MAKARKRKGRPVHGILLLDKPKGLSSNQALQRVKWLMKAQKAGHTGNLDPMATGMLPLCFGNATRVSAFLLDADKYYTASVKLGERTDTADADGEVIERLPVPELTLAVLEAVAARFIGVQQQIPPMYSALKQGGQRLYKLARQGIEVERPPREITIYALTELALTDDGFSFAVHCSKGTYVRVLAEDMAEALGTNGHLVALRRDAVAGFDADLPLISPTEIERAVEVDDTEVAKPDGADHLLHRSDLPLADWPQAQLNADAAWSLTHGNPVFAAEARKHDEGVLVRAYNSDDEFIGIAQVTEDGRLAPHRIFPLPAAAES